MSYPTWSDLNSESVIPPLGSRKAPFLNTVAVMASCEPDFRRISSTMNATKQPFFTSTLVIPEDDKGTCVVGPFIGAPYAAMILESLIARGVNKVIVTGWCGAVSENIRVGDLVIPDPAIVDEGTSANYAILDEKMPCSFPDKELGRRLAGILEQDGIAVKQVPVWTTDAIYRETPSKIAYFRQQGAQVVEMECSALFSVAAYRKVAISALLVVSDSVAETTWDPGFRKTQFKHARKDACAAVMKLAGILGDDG